MQLPVDKAILMCQLNQTESCIFFFSLDAFIRKTHYYQNLFLLMIS